VSINVYKYGPWNPPRQLVALNVSVISTSVCPVHQKRENQLKFAAGLIILQPVAAAARVVTALSAADSGLQTSGECGGREGGCGISANE
jgi:hypothetical protein